MVAKSGLCDRTRFLGIRWQVVSCSASRVPVNQMEIGALYFLLKAICKLEAVLWLKTQIDRELNKCLSSESDWRV